MKRMCRNSLFLLVITGFLFASLWSCASLSKPDTQTNVTYYVHTVKWPGESLSIIAGWYTGDIENWKILAKANPDSDPDVVVIGQKIRIQEDIMTTKSPLTKGYVDSYYPKAGKQKTRSSPSETKDETPILYGPKLQPQK